MAPDLWKALGCFHGPLTEMVRKCLHGSSPYLPLISFIFNLFLSPYSFDAS